MFDVNWCVGFCRSQGPGRTRGGELREWCTTGRAKGVVCVASGFRLVQIYEDKIKVTDQQAHELFDVNMLLFMSVVMAEVEESGEVV